MVKRGREARSACLAGTTMSSVAGLGVLARSDGAGDDAATLATAASFLLRFNGLLGGIAVKTAIAGDASRGEPAASMLENVDSVVMNHEWTCVKATK